MLARGLRNCNPLNIRRVAGTKWKGQSTLQTDASFVCFNAMEWGIRAAFCILRTYARRYQCLSPADIVGRWAPPHQNDTDAYIRNVCTWTGFGGRQHLTEADWPRLVQAMARQESGTTLSEEIINKGFKLYKNQP
ncbi:MAG: hypothetical protein IJ020_02850 [Bacteroidaceae bacterium]|nr:hypothetical protein [Bacteroidaceae bacterium]